MKRIAYLIVDNGVDGREPDRVVGAYWNEYARERALQQDKSKHWHSQKEIIIDTDADHAVALAKLTAIDRLVLGLAGPDVAIRSLTS